MRIDFKPFVSTFRRLHPTFARLAGIFAGIYVMGAHDFLIFYFVHLVLKSLGALFFIDSAENAHRAVRKKSALALSHVALLFTMSAMSTLVVLAFYFSVILLFDHVIAPDVIDVGFFTLYALTITGNLLMPLVGVIQAKATFWVRTFVLRGRYLMTLVFIAAFVFLGFNSALLPYVWLLTSLIMSALVLSFGLYYLKDVQTVGSALPIDWTKGKTVSKDIINSGVRRTSNRATFLATKGVMSAFLGPFAGLALKTIQFDNARKRERYVAKIKKKDFVSRVGERIPDKVKRGVADDRPYWVVLALAILALAIMIAFKSTLDAVILLGLLMLASKMLSVSLRILVLNSLIARGFTSMDASATSPVA